MPAAILLAPHEVLHGLRNVVRMALETCCDALLVAQPQGEAGDVTGIKVQEGVEISGDDLYGA